MVSFALSSAESDSLVKLSVDRWVGWASHVFAVETGGIICSVKC